MTPSLTPRLAQLADTGLNQTLVHIVRGIEKEGLRVTTASKLSQQGHPLAFGSALTHPYITTDYSESLLEFITPAGEHISDTLGFLEQIHRYSASELADEHLWPASMPCAVQGNKSVPIAQYGSSRAGQMKHIYRRGLDIRYGRIMQSIAGIHFNFSLPDSFWQGYRQLLGSQDSLADFRSAQYFGLIRNFRRYGWLLLYLFGASPALSQTFMQGRPHKLSELGADTLYLPYATSLRMSGLGYQSDAQTSLKISTNSLTEYSRDLTLALNTPYPPYTRLGVEVNGDTRQLNDNILQIENEYYSDIRPKRVTRADETPLQAMAERGVEYIEVRNLDINPLLALGIDDTQIRFLDAFLLFCLLQDSPEIGEQESQRITRNQTRITEQGRKPDLLLETASGELSRTICAEQIFAELAAVALLLDKTSSGYADAVQHYTPLLQQPELTPSARILQQLTSSKLEYTTWTQQRAVELTQYWQQAPLSSEQTGYFKQLATSSLAAQQRLETEDAITPLAACQ
ncbi:glutamate--cysteine ligase [Rheinheimera salexigens]|uniref:Glutamate--cysteine ligase n=1 Tax=Rheinheimera salexigens TaxID=1628148 RepID=A0A1E7Q9Q8_9GAMM|nr:glutamate--cysteine ligase [Rheinheimera salexigens]OEY70793.1 glutamate--cysteine ligase [Rheinheimera salexigens]